mmetsp:Transcript_14713/g.20172  ORF Transcript_14713/g.20172 Transcript_14713/m.20172 type:complete len:135 (-) Transcript_14713:187-591(-)
MHTLKGRLFSSEECSLKYLQLFKDYSTSRIIKMLSWTIKITIYHIILISNQVFSLILAFCFHYGGNNNINNNLQLIMMEKIPKIIIMIAIQSMANSLVEGKAMMSRILSPSLSCREVSVIEYYLEFTFEVCFYI